MLTIDIRVNGKLIAQAELVNQSNLAEVSDYRLKWNEDWEPGLGIPGCGGAAIIKGHRRRQSVWALVAKATVAILDQLVVNIHDPR